MTTTFHITGKELTMDFLKVLKSLYKGKPISITIEDNMDETEYLMASKANRKMLDKSIKEAKEGKFIAVNIDDLR